MVEIEIINWKKHNPNECLKTPNWFRVSIEVTSSESLYGLSPEIKWVWICLLSHAMKKKTGTFEINLEWAAKHWDLSFELIKTALEEFKKRGLMQCNSEEAPRKLGVGSEDPRSQNRIEKNRKEYMGSKKEPDTNFNFEEILKNYPKRSGSLKKKTAILSLTKSIKNQGSLLLLTQAVENYRLWCDREKKTGTEFVMQLSTFANCWEEWVEPDSANVPKKPFNFLGDDK